MSENTNSINELDLVALTTSLTSQSLPAGQTGTVVHVHGHGEAFEVEFPLTPRRSVVTTVRPEHLLKLHGLPVLKAS